MIYCSSCDERFSCYECDLCLDCCECDLDHDPRLAAAKAVEESVMRAMHACFTEAI